MTTALQALLCEARNTALLEPLVRKYMGVLGLHTAPDLKVSNRLGARMLGSCRWRPGQPTTTITVEKSVMDDAATLERIVAHEMAHHAVFLDNIRELEATVQQYGAEAGPHVQRYVRTLQLRTKFSAGGHGDDWLRYAEIINAKMGSKFVTVTSDSSYVKSTETKPYYVLVAKLPDSRYGYQIGVVFSAKMKRFVATAAVRYDGRLVKTTDAKWEHGPRIGGSNWAVSPDKQAELEKLHASRASVQELGLGV